MSYKTVVVACHLYEKDSENFKEKCSGQSCFHSEILRDLILHYIKFEGSSTGFLEDTIWHFDGPERGWVKVKKTT